MKKRLLTTILAAALALSTALPARAASFSDVPDTFWAAQYIDDAAAHGYVEGVGDGRYNPGGTVTYGEFAAMVTRVLFAGELEEYQGDAESWYSPYVSVCLENGVFDGTMFELSGETRPMTRAELAVVIANALDAAGAKRPGVEELLAVEVPDLYAYGLREAASIRAVYALGVMNGNGDTGRFEGLDNMDRAQAAAVLMRMSRVELEPETEQPDPDTDTDTEPEPAPAPDPDPDPEPDRVPEPDPDPNPDPNPEPNPEPNPDPGEQETDGLDPETVYNAMIAMKERYPEGTRWTNENSYAWRGGIFNVGYGCAGFAFLLSDAAFGELPARMVKPVRLSDVRVGDILRINNNTHSVIVLEVTDSGVVIAEGNYNSSVHWGRTLTKSQVESASYILTRYPEQ